MPQIYIPYQNLKTQDLMTLEAAVVSLDILCSYQNNTSHAHAIRNLLNVIGNNEDKLRLNEATVARYLLVVYDWVRYIIEISHYQPSLPKQSFNRVIAAIRNYIENNGDLASLNNFNIRINEFIADYLLPSQEERYYIHEKVSSIPKKFFHQIKELSSNKNEEENRTFCLRNFRFNQGLSFKAYAEQQKIAFDELKNITQALHINVISPVKNANYSKSPSM